MQQGEPPWVTGSPWRHKGWGTSSWITREEQGQQVLKLQLKAAVKLAGKMQYPSVQNCTAYPDVWLLTKYSIVVQTLLHFPHISPVSTFHLHLVM